MSKCVVWTLEGGGGVGGGSGDGGPGGLTGAGSGVAEGF